MVLVLWGAMPPFDAVPPERGAWPEEPPAELGPSFIISFIISYFPN